MSKAKITLIGFEQYLNQRELSLFDAVLLPDGIEKSDLVDTILLRCGEFEVLYSDINFIKDAIALWFRKYNRTFSKWITALNIEYNPLENYDRMEDWNDDTNAEGSGSGSVTSSRAAFDSSTFENDTLSENETSSTASTQNHKVGRAHGNIGVTTSQQMLQAELDVAKWSLYDQIADLFMQEFCIAVY